MKFKKGDNIIIIKGKDKKKKGKIIRVLKKDNKVIIEGLNMVKKNQKPRKTNEKGSIISIAMPINVSNIMIVDPKTGKGSRMGKKKIGDKFVRISKKSNQEI